METHDQVATWWIVKQGDGRLARFSDLISDFTDLDMTEMEAILVCQREGMSTEDAFEEVQIALDSSSFRLTVAIRIIRKTYGDPLANDRAFRTRHEDSNVVTFEL